MRFAFSQTECTNLHYAFQHEWIETNGLGGYASSTIAGCNTRKYHGLFVVNLARFADRHVLLSAIEDSVTAGSSTYAISTRQHPGVFHPDGHTRMTGAVFDICPTFSYRYGDMKIRRSLMLVHQKNLLLIRYDFMSPPPDAVLHLAPLASFRSFHSLTHQNASLDTKTHPLPNGFSFQPYENLPPLCLQSDMPGTDFIHSPDWCRTVQYAKEQERGFPYEEDLYLPGSLNIPVARGTVYLAVGLRPFHEQYSAPRTMEEVWMEEQNRRKLLSGNSPFTTPIERQLHSTAHSFIVRQPNVGTSVLAGYPWFNAWGRDTFIALPGLCFCSGLQSTGMEILIHSCEHARNGLVPNVLSPNGDHSYNSVDASLWYVWAVQQMLIYAPETISAVQEKIWPFLKEIVTAYSSVSKPSPVLKQRQTDRTPLSAEDVASSETQDDGVRSGVPYTVMDSAGFLQVGTADTQLTWMDATAYGKPVTPRAGYPVEINALWYNALCFINGLAKQFKESPPFPPRRLGQMPHLFMKRFWVSIHQEAFLADVWHPDAPSYQIRPNQLFAVALPYPIVQAREQAQAIIQTVARHLLTPYGLRTLSPDDSQYCPSYQGTPDQRDAAYHQGTVWPWLLGAYGEAMLKTSDDKTASATDLLQHITPLLQHHLREAGIGSISEIFGAEPPHRPDGCISQAWSIAEVFRLITIIKDQCPDAFEAFAGSL